jgi:hypothetical protein
MNIHYDAARQRELQEERRKKMAKYGRLDNDDKFVERKTPHLEYQDKLYDGLLAIDAVIGVVEMYASHEMTFKAHLHAVKEMLEARIDE